MNDLVKFMMGAMPVQPGARAKAHMVSHPTEQWQGAKRAKSSNDTLADAKPVVDLTGDATPADTEFNDWMEQGMAEDKAAAELEAMFESLSDVEESDETLAQETLEVIAGDETPEAEERGKDQPVQPEPSEPDAKKASAKKTQGPEAKKAGEEIAGDEEAKKLDVSAESAAGVSDVFAKYLRLSALMLAKPDLFDCAMPEEISTWGDWYDENKSVLSDLPRSAHPKPLCNRGAKSYTLFLTAKITVRLDSCVFYIKQAVPWCVHWGFNCDINGGISIGWRKHGAGMAWMLARLFAGELDGLAPQYPAPIR
jgi:hypothetical protein